MKHPLFIILCGLGLGGIAIPLWQGLRNDEERLPDERRVAMLLLQEQHAGPGYFHPDGDSAPDEHGIFWISSAQAFAQIDRLLNERRIAGGARTDLTALVREVSEPHPSRAVGGDRINVARLNVAVDARWPSR